MISIILFVSIIVAAIPLHVVLNHAESAVRTTLISQTGKTVIAPNKLAQPLKTGQRLCYSVAGAVISCVGTGQDGEYRLGIATSTKDNGNNTISDNATGLMWIKDHNAVGAPFNSTMTWNNATSSCEALSYAGYTDWRLPNIKELQTLVDFGRVSPAIDTVKFPNTQSFSSWSATTFVYPGYEHYAWSVGFTFGDTYYGSKSVSSYVRCVRGIR